MRAGRPRHSGRLDGSDVTSQVEPSLNKAHVEDSDEANDNQHVDEPGQRIGIRDPRRSRVQHDSIDLRPGRRIRERKGSKPSRPDLSWTWIPGDASGFPMFSRSLFRSNLPSAMGSHSPDMAFSSQFPFPPCLSRLRRNSIRDPCSTLGLGSSSFQRWCGRMSDDQIVICELNESAMVSVA